MKAIKIYISTIFFIALTLHSCNFSDSTENLGDDYFYRNEGETVKDIICKKANGGEIPATVTHFDFNDKFIIAKQIPKLPLDPLYDHEYKYNRGNKEYYYWIIVKESSLVLGPLSLGEFNNQKIKYKIPNSLILK
jgi:hypothetical protein